MVKIFIFLLLLTACSQKTKKSALQPLSTPVDTQIYVAEERILESDFYKPEDPPYAEEAAQKNDIDLPPPVLENVPTTENVPIKDVFQAKTPLPGAENMLRYLPMLQGKRVALVVNATSKVGKTHLLDTLLFHNIEVVRLFAPEHGLRGEADAGEEIKNDRDSKTGLPIISLHGKIKKPLPDHLADIDIVVFDIQDVGVRFYTYISTLHYVMEACAEQNKQLVLLDRPNPNAHRVAGPTLQKGFSSFVGMHPVPLLYGLTIGEYANLINQQEWLKNGIQCVLSIVLVSDYDRYAPWTTEMPERPSPNLPNLLSINLYPSVCLFEGTVVSVGRGTSAPFQLFGCPDCVGEVFFTPHPNYGAKDPLYNDIKCFGTSLLLEYRHIDVEIKWLLEQHAAYPNKDKFFLENKFFDKLAGNSQLRLDIIAGKSESEIRATWEADLQKFVEIRQKCMLYP